ncbi:hypothetical protein H0H87_008257 [Tephrocybe sp. NHM501043]|nr:hypothetical protein H0H87_008257 [Tephrocybe sp. NHM501043]
MSLLTRSDLRELKYQALQQLAKREGIKANRKKDVIVDLLLQKYPEGVRRSAFLFFDSTKRQRVVVNRDTNGSVRNWVQELRSRQHSLAPSPMHAPSPEPTPLRSPLPHVYCFKGARRARRDIVHLVNDSAAIHQDLSETEALLRHATKTYDRATRKLEGFACMRRSLQTMYGTMKRDRTVLDGTGEMNILEVDSWTEYANKLDRLRQEQQDQVDIDLHKKQLALTQDKPELKKVQEKESEEKESEENELNNNRHVPLKRKRATIWDDDDELEYV